MRSLWNIFTGKQRPGEWPLDILCCVIACSYGQDSFGLRSVPQPEAKMALPAELECSKET